MTLSNGRTINWRTIPISLIEGPMGGDADVIAGFLSHEWLSVRQ